jgi:hypothetical protein
MSEVTKSEDIRQKIKLELEKLDLPWFFLTELDKMFGYIGYYKLRNLWNNKKCFLNYINELNNQYEKDFLNILDDHQNDKNRN